MNLNAPQADIVAQLMAGFMTASLPFVAKNLPDNDAGFDKAVLNPIVYVCYTGSKTDPSQSTNIIMQVRRLAFTIEIHARSLYKANGLKVAQDVVEQILIGYKPSNCQRLYSIKDDISKTTDGIWIGVLQMECQTMLVQKEDNDPIIVPSFVELINND